MGENYFLIFRFPERLWFSVAKSELSVVALMMGLLNTILSPTTSWRMEVMVMQCLKKLKSCLKQGSQLKWLSICISWSSLLSELKWMGGLRTYATKEEIFFFVLMNGNLWAHLLKEWLENGLREGARNTDFV